MGMSIDTSAFEAEYQRGSVQTPPLMCNQVLKSQVKKCIDVDLISSSTTRLKSIDFMSYSTITVTK